VAHAADAPARMPERDRYAGAEQGGDARISTAEMKLPRLEYDRLNALRGRMGEFHGLR